MACLLAMSFDFKALIDGIKNLTINDFIVYSEVDYFNFWKVSHNFVETF